MNKMRIAAGALALTLAPTMAAAPANASTDITSYSYHSDWHCHATNLIYAGEPHTPGYIVVWWYRDYKTVRYFTLAEQLRYGIKTSLLRSWTVFSHRSYPRAVRCAGVW